MLLTPISWRQKTCPSERTAAGKAYFISQGEPVNLWDWINELFVAMDIDEGSDINLISGCLPAGGTFWRHVYTCKIEKRAENDPFSC